MKKELKEQEIHANNKIKDLETQVERANEKNPPVTTGKQKGVQKCQAIVKILMPEIKFCRQSFEVMYDIESPTKALEVLKQLVNEPTAKGWKSVQDVPGWFEHDFGKLKKHRIYRGSENSQKTGEKYEVLISTKNKQTNDIKWIKEHSKKAS